MKSLPKEFTHRTAPENHLIFESICRYCNLGIGASSKTELLELLEGTHCCDERVAAQNDKVVELKKISRREARDNSGANPRGGSICA